jgi:hypothetical protein
MPRICLNANCSKRSTFGKLNSKISEYCSKHKPDGYVNVKDKQCLNANCSKQPHYGKTGSKKAEYCSTHKPDGYVNVKDKQCLNANCSKLPVYGKTGSKKAEYCSTHKPDCYVDVIHNRCLNVNCSKRPYFGKTGSKKAEYCSTHKPDGYVNVNDKQCLNANCSKIPTYGKTGSKKAEYCYTHKPDGYTDVKSKQCLNANCSKQPYFGKTGSKKAEYCYTHKPDGYVNVKDKQCLNVNCVKRSSFGKRGYSAEYCADHKLPDMIRASKSKKALEDIVCKYCSITIHYNEEFCSGCKSFRDKGATIKTIRKETRIKYILEEHKFKFEHDKRVSGGCTRKRPDFVIDTNWGAIILEVDEFQHNRKSYPEACEITRMKQIYFDVGVEHIVFVRYNPDAYVSEHGIVTSTDREALLIKTLNELVTADIGFFDFGLGVTYLFYDKFNHNDMDLEVIDPYD